MGGGRGKPGGGCQRAMEHGTPWAADELNGMQEQIGDQGG